MDGNYPVKIPPNLINFPLNVWHHILGYTSPSDIISLSSVCKDLQTIVQTIKDNYNLCCCYSLNTNCLLNFTLSTTCTSINLNYCFWLEPETILEIIAKTQLKHLHVIECEMSEACVKAICDLPLFSMSISYTKQWKIYFERHLSHSLPCFQMLKSLEMFSRSSSTLERDSKSETMIYEVYAKVLHHCKELEHLKLFDIDRVQVSSDKPIRSKFPLGESTPFPKLKSVIINYICEENETDLVHFLKFILKDKVIPLEHVNFGKFTSNLIKNGLFFNPLILPNKSTFLLCCDRFSPLRSWLQIEGVKSLMFQTSYKNIILQGLKLEGFPEFVQTIVSNSGNSIEEFSIINCTLNEHVLKEISFIAINCSQITVLEILINKCRDLDNYISADAYTRNQGVFDAISNLQNLKKLSVSSYLFHSHYYDWGGFECKKAIQFCKVTKACKQLIEIKVKGSGNYPCEYFIDEESLYDIAHCENLQVLELSNFQLQSSNFTPSKITKNCQQLQKLYIFEVTAMIDITSYEEFLSYTKRIKEISLNIYMGYGHENINVTKKFIDNLCQCENLERIFLRKFFIHDDYCQYLADSLLKLKHLCALIIISRGNCSSSEYLKSALRKIKQERPAFFSRLSPSNALSAVPVAHFDLTKHY